MISKELKILKDNWKCTMSPQEDGQAPICIEMIYAILDKFRTLDVETLVKELDKLSEEDRWYLCPYVIDELAYDDGRKVAEPYIVD